MEEFEWSCPTCGRVFKFHKTDIHTINSINAHQLSHGDI